ncbi:class I SAM-dependent DNA methyltransferase [Streptomyces sp. YKOK-I1]
MTDLDVDFLHAARASYDAIAEPYTEEFADGLGHRHLDRALLTGFADLVKERGGGEPVADVGSGPGYVTRRLDALGLSVFGVDISPRMVALASRAHPHLRFHVGSMTGLDLPDRSLAGLVALYSVIHVPDGELPSVLREFRRVLVPGGHLLLAFQTGRGERMHITERFGHEISLRYWLRDPEVVAGLLEEAGFAVLARAVLAPEEGRVHPRAWLLAQVPGV